MSLTQVIFIGSFIGVFYELFKTIGVKNAQVEELICLDDEFFNKLQ